MLVVHKQDIKQEPEKSERKEAVEMSGTHTNPFIHSQTEINKVHNPPRANKSPECQLYQMTDLFKTLNTAFGT